MKSLINLNIAYSSIQGTYWMVYGFVSSFASVFLLARKYSNTEIGIILASANVIAVLLQPFLADAADRSQKVSLIGIVQMIAGMMMLMVAGILLMKNKSCFFTAVFVLLISWHTVLQPLINTLSFKLQETGVHINFGIARGIGSLAYSSFMAILGSMVKNYGTEILPIIAEVVLTLMMGSLYLTRCEYNTLKKGEKKSLPEVQDADIQKIDLLSFIRRNKLFCVVGIGIVGLFFSNSVMNNYMMQIVADVGGDSEDMGKVMSLMAFLEIPTMVMFDSLKKRITCQSMIKVGAIGFTVKIVICHLADSVAVIFAAQFLQIAAFGLFLPAMVHFIDEIMSRGEAVKGQTLFTMMITITTIFSSLAGGIILDMSNAKTLTLTSSAATAAGAAIILLTVGKIGRKTENEGNH